MLHVLVRKMTNRLADGDYVDCHALKMSLYSMHMVQNVRNKQQATTKQDSLHRYREGPVECGNGAYLLLRGEVSCNQKKEVVFT